MDRGFLLVFGVFIVMGLFFWGGQALTAWATHRASDVVEEIEAAKASLRFSQSLAYQSRFHEMSDNTRFVTLALLPESGSKESFLRRRLLFGRKLIVNDFFTEAQIQ